MIVLDNARKKVSVRKLNLSLLSLNSGFTGLFLMINGVQSFLEMKSVTCIFAQTLRNTLEIWKMVLALLLVKVEPSFLTRRRSPSGSGKP